MSGVNWNYFRKVQTAMADKGKHTMSLAMMPRAQIIKSQRKEFDEDDTNENLSSLMQYEETPGDSEKLKTGRAWRIDELRLKNHDDLHKLWYVLLKEKNKLKSDSLMAIQMQQFYFRYNDLKKVKLSMARLLTVVNERKKLRAMYRAHLEDEYIKLKKQHELEAFLAERERRKQAGETKLPMTQAEVHEHLERRQNMKNWEMRNNRNAIQAEIDKK